MKKSYPYPNCFVLMLFACCLLVTSCGDDADQKVENKAFSVKVKLIDDTDRKLTDTVLQNTVMFVFDDKDVFIERINISGKSVIEGETFELPYQNTDSIRIVACANLFDDNIAVSALTVGSSKIGDLTFTMKEQGDTPLSTSAIDLFLGEQVINRQAKAQSVILQLKTAKIRISIAGIKPAKTDSYHCIIKNGIARTFNYKGEPMEEFTKYKIPLTISKDTLLVGERIIFPYNTNSSVDLYKKDVLIASDDEDAETSAPFRFEVGAVTTIRFDFDSNFDK